MNSFFKENEVSPLAAAVAEEIRKYDMIRPGERVVVGLSGGPDSVCLLAVLSELRVQLGIESLHAVHVNHGLRGAESDRDERYAEQLAMSMGASFDAARYDVRKLAAEQKLSEEEMGRKLRYETFEQFRQTYGAHRIAVAHNRNDQAETVMMRILRGTGLRGLSGISRIRGDGILIRPLLGVGRGTIEAYCRDQGLEPGIDSTNLEPVYTRNRIRLNLFPLLEKEYNPQIQEALVRLGEQASLAEDFVRQEAVRYLDGKRSGELPRWNASEYSADPEGFEELHSALKTGVVLEMLERCGAAQNITAETVGRVIRTALSLTEPSEADLQDGRYVRKVYGRLWFLKRNQDENYKIKEPIPLPIDRLRKERKAELQAGILLLRLSLSEREGDGSRNRHGFAGSFRGRTGSRSEDSGAEPQDQGGTDCRTRRSVKTVRAVMDLEKVLEGGTPVFRNRLPGDRFRPVGMKGRKKIQDLFTDRKIPRQERDTVLLLARGHEVLLAGDEVSGNCAVSGDSRNLLIIEYTRSYSVPQ